MSQKKIIFLKVLKLASVALFTSFANAAELTLESDLMIHPKQIETLLGTASQNVRASSSWAWAALSFVKPYKTFWSQVAARGPFDLRVEASAAKPQEIDFEFAWADPALQVGRFEIRDTVVREVGGARIIIHLDGACSNMSVRIPGGAWRVKGRFAWSGAAGSLTAQWQEFHFQSAAGASAQVDLGQCEGPAALHQELKSTVEEFSRDPQLLAQLLREGIMDWIGNELSVLQAELLKPRQAAIRKGLNLEWRPAQLRTFENGVLRVSGELALRKNGQELLRLAVPRTQEEAHLAFVEESGFVLPKDALGKVFEFLFQTGGLRERVESDRVESFRDLMQSRFLQFFVWPDLMNFGKSSKFYFDVSAARSPRLSRGRMTRTGVAYDVQVPLLVKTWAPAPSSYLPYVDFSTPTQGILSASVNDGQLLLQLNPQSLNIQSAFRSEYKKLRRVNEWVSESVLGSGVESFLRERQMSLPLPNWELSEAVSLEILDLQVWKQSFRLPLGVKSKLKSSK